jgi:putative transposase
VPVGCRLEGQWLRVMNVGRVKTLAHRPLEGTPKTATLRRRRRTGKWDVTFSCECTEPAPLPEPGHEVGSDVGLGVFAMPTDGEPIANPRFFRQEEQALAKAQRRLAKEEKGKGTPERAARRRVVARVHERVAWRRGDFAQRHSRRIVDAFDLIAVEDLSVNRMTHTQCLATRIHDAAWTQFTALLAHQAAGAGRRFVAVNPADPSQDCSGCGPRQTLSLAERTSACPCCGLVLDRDLNAARTILALGRQCLASA